MINLLNDKIEHRDDCCDGCGLPFKNCHTPPHLRREFQRMTGKTWPGPVVLNLHKDCRSLAINTEGKPERTTVCLICCMRHMRDFNERLNILNGGRLP